MPVAADRQRLQDLLARNRSMAQLCRLTAEVAKLGEERATLRKIVDTAVRFLGVQAAHLALVDRLGESLYGLVSSGRHARRARRLRVALSEAPAARRTIESGRALTIDRARGDRRVNPLARRVLSIGAAAYLPLRSGRQVFGLLILVTREPHRWQRGEIEMGRHFADVAAVAIENGRLLAQLSETERRLRGLVEHIPAVTYTCEVEPPFRTSYLSPQAEAMLGFSMDEIRRDPNFWMRLTHPDDLKSIIDRSAEAVRRRGLFSMEYRMFDRQGEVRWFRDEATLVRDPAGRPVSWHGVVVDITGLKRLALAAVRDGVPDRGRRPERREPPPA